METIESHVESTTSGIIAIDGDLGAGKTTLSESLKQKYGIRSVNVDDYLEGRRGEYVPALDLEGLKKSIENGSFPVIVEGVCMLDIFSKIGIEPEVHIFVEKPKRSDYKSEYPIVAEVGDYINTSEALKKSDEVVVMENTETNPLDVDKTYIRSKTVVSAFLSLGGIVALLVGAYILSTGISSQSSAVFEFLGAKVTAEGIGAVMMSSSVFWAYFAYRSRPQYRRHRETMSRTSPEGGRKQSEFVSASMAATKPEPQLDEIESSTLEAPDDSSTKSRSGRREDTSRE